MAAQRDEYEFITRFRSEALEAARRAEEALRGMGNAADGVSDKMDDADDAMERAKSAAVALATVVASAAASFLLIRNALSTFAEFETAMLGIAKVSDLTDQELQGLGDSFERMAYQAGLPIEDFLRVAEVAGQLGINGVGNIEAFTSAMVDLGGASNITAEEGATAIARMLNVTKEGIGTARTVASVLVELGNISAATEREIVDRAQEIALATAAFGMNTTEALAMGAVMAELGLRAETSGTAIGRVFISMSEAVVKGGKDVELFARATGLTTQAFRDMQATDPTGLFYRLLETMSDKSQNEIVKTLTDLNILNAENAKTLIPMITGYERVREVRERAFEEMENPDALDKEAARAAESLARSWEGLMQGLQAEVRQLGELIAPIAQAFIDLGKAALDAFNALPEVVQNTILLLGVIGPTLLAAAVAVKVLTLAFGLLIPAGLSAAAMGGAAAAGIAGMGVAGQVAGAGLAVLRYGLGALLGPIGLVLAVAGTLAYVLMDSEQAVVDFDSQLAQAETAMDAYADATKRAKEEQIGLREGISEATQELLNQSRTALQTAKDQLELSRAGFDDQSIEGKYASQVEGELRGVGEALEELYRQQPGNDVFPAVAGLIGDLRTGKITADEARDALNKYLGAGDEAVAIVSRYRNAAANLYSDPEEFRAALTALRDYAQQTGLFTEDLEFIGRMVDEGDTEAAMLAVAELAAEVEYLGEAGEDLRDFISPALIEAIANAADAEVRIAAMNAALEGNHELAKEIIRTGNPFATLEAGAEDAETAVRNMATAMSEAYALYDRFTEFDPTVTDRGAWLRDAGTAAERGMLDLISYAEGTGEGTRGYNETLGRGALTGGDVNLINMTLREVLELQRQMLAHPDNARMYGDPSSAVGRYQIVGTTLGGEGLTGEGGLIARLNLSLDELFTPQLQDRLALELLRGRQGQGVEGLRNEWEGLRNIPEQTIVAGMSGQVIPRMDPELEREQKRLLDEQTRALEEQADARANLNQSQEDAIAAAELEISLIGKSVYEQARLRTEFDLLNQAKRDGIDVDSELAASGRTYREEIEATARSMAELAVQEERQRNSAERAAKAQEFYNQQQEVFQQGVLDAILEGENLVDVLGSIAKAFARAALEAALFGSGPFGGGGGGLLGGIFGKIFGGITKIAASADGNVFAEGKGNAVSIVAYAKGGRPNSLSDYENEVIRKPTFFDMGEDQIGLMGEAGDEAVMPLKGGKVRAVIGGVETLLSLERMRGGQLGVTIPEALRKAMDPEDIDAYAYGGVPGGMPRDAPQTAAAMRGEMGLAAADQARVSAPGALSIDYNPTYILNIEGGTATVESKQGSAPSGKDQERLLEGLDAVLRAKMLDFLSNEMRNGGMLNPSAKPYG